MRGRLWGEILGLSIYLQLYISIIFIKISEDHVMVRSCVHVSFSSLWAAFMLTVHINALYNESVHRKEQRTSEIITIP